MQLKKRLPFVLACVVIVLSLPVLSILSSWLWLDASSWQILKEMAEHLLPEYTLNTFYLAFGVLVGSTTIGVATALCVSIFELKARKFWEWALLLPMAMPAYVLAYAYTDFFQFSGAFQNFLRQSFALEGRLIPEIRSLPGAIVVLSLCLYPYIYLLTRSALLQRSHHLLDAAKLLGLSVSGQIVKVILPLARPSIAVGITLVLMETFADYGVTSYFGVQTFSTGIYKAWLVMDNRVAAAQLSSFLLLLVAVVLWMEYRAQSRLRFVTRRGASRGHESQALRLHGWHAALAFVLCVLPVLLGFVIGSSRLAYAAVYPLMTAFNALPKAAFVPILVVWFGIGAGPAILTQLATPVGQAIVTRMEKGRIGRLSDQDLIDLPVLYRTVASSLSIARETSLDAATLAYLESLAQRAWFLVYGPRTGLWAWFTLIRRKR